MFVSHFPDSAFIRDLDDVLLYDLALRGGRHGLRRGCLAGEVGEGTEPSKGEGASEGSLHRLPARHLLPGGVLTLQALYTLLGKTRKQSVRLPIICILHHTTSHFTALLVFLNMQHLQKLYVLMCDKIVATYAMHNKYVPNHSLLTRAQWLTSKCGKMVSLAQHMRMRE